MLLEMRMQPASQAAAVPYVRIGVVADDNQAAELPLLSEIGRTTARRKEDKDLKARLEKKRFEPF
jgi:hypothetical protein